jgi:small subunit ribosomal protein S6
VFSPAASEERVNVVMARIQRSITENGGSIVKQDQWGIRRLAYPIRHFNEGNYILTQYTAEPKVCREIQDFLGVTDEAIRYLNVELPTTLLTRRKSRRKRAKAPKAARPASAPAQPPAAAQA